MNPSSRITSLQAYHLLLFRNAIHPEFFEIEGRRHIQHGEYEFEAWITRGGHTIRFEHHGLCLTEVVSDQNGLPERGLVATLPCAGEKDHQAEFGDRVEYIASITTETLTDHLYLDTYNEMIEHGRKGDGLMAVWRNDIGKPNMSLVDIQRYSDNVEIQTWHLRSDCGLVLRTQTIFQVRESS